MSRSYSVSTDNITTSAPGVTGTGARSTSVWFKTTDTRTTATNWVYGWGSNAVGHWWQLNVANGVIYCRCNTTYGSWGSGYNDGKWHNVVLTFPAGGAMGSVSCYVDGTLLTGSYNPGTTTINTGTTSPVSIGSAPQTTGKWVGSLAELVIWNVQLSGQEAAALGARVHPRRIRPGAIVNYWPLWGLQSPEPDLGGSGYYGTLTGTAYDNHAPITLFTPKARAEVEPASGGGSSLALAAQSAAWTNPWPAQLFAASLGQESASWTNPALSPASTLALGQESASWTNPALSEAVALALAAESASWTNPALAALHQLALAAESASWTNPLLNLALSLALTSQPVAWSNPALTPSGSQGVVLLLPAESAVFSVNPLGLFYCPTIVNPYFGLEWLVVVPGLPALVEECSVISNTEVVTLYRKLSDGTFDGGTLIGQALRLDDQKSLTGGGRGLLKRNELSWYLWASQTGSPEVKNGDVIQDAAGRRWTIWNTDVQAWGNRFFVQTKLENVNIQ